MTSLTRFIEGRLKLQVNAQKSAVARPWQRSFLGFTVGGFKFRSEHPPDGWRHLLAGQSG